jgi:predicted RNase H-like HicB family nuclease
MSHMRSTIHFNVWQEDGMYIAAAVDVPIATEGATFEELQENIRDVVAVYFEDEDLASLGFERLPTILTNFEVSPQAYAGRT